MGGFMGIGGGSAPSPPKPPTDTAATKSQAELLRRRQGGGLATQTDTSAFRQMVAAYSSLKSNLGA